VDAEIEATGKHQMKLPRWKRNLIWVLRIFVLLYSLPYIPLSLAGHYSDRAVASGRNKYSFGLSIPDEFVWEPLAVKALPNDMNILGAIYYVPVQVDRRIWHRSYRLDVERRK